jgi:cell division protein FtsI (penicillin-binding protein 3)
LDESSPDHLGASLDLGDVSESAMTAPAAKASPISTQVIPASQTARAPDQTAPGTTTVATSSVPATVSPATSSEDSSPQKLPGSGTVVLDVEEGGIEVPSFLGKNLRFAVEAAQEVGLDLDAIGSGVAREQSPLPGARVAAGSRVTVRFGR